jgi:hypothetical protein
MTAPTVGYRHLGHPSCSTSSPTSRPGPRGRAGRRALTAWTRLHGFVSLEIEGNYASMGVDPDRLFDFEVTALLDAAGPDRPESGAGVETRASPAP